MAPLGKHVEGHASTAYQAMDRGSGNFDEMRRSASELLNATAGAERDSYAANGYVLLKQLFPPLVLAIFHRQMQQDLELKGNPAFVSQTNLLTKPAIEVYSRQYAPMATFHWGLTPRIAEIAGCELVPTYAYFRAYQQGDVCLVHSDRYACEHNLSLTIHLSDGKPWALSVEHREIQQAGAVVPDFGEHEFSSLPMSAADA